MFIRMFIPRIVCPSLLFVLLQLADGIGSMPVYAQDTAEVLRTIYVSLRTDDIFMSQTPVQPQEIDSLMAVVERHRAKMQFAVIPSRLIEPQNADGQMAETLRKYLRRGHMVSQHGWTHRHAPTGNTGGEFQNPVTGEWVPYDTVMKYTRFGKELLEQTLGIPVTTYVSPGNDDQLHPLNLRVLRELGFTWVTGVGNVVPIRTDSICYLPDMQEFTWALADSTYERALERAKADFIKTISRSDHWAHCYHDHFTRFAWNNGIVARWTDELLTWIEHFPGITIKYITVNDL